MPVQSHHYDCLASSSYHALLSPSYLLPATIAPPQQLFLARCATPLLCRQNHPMLGAQQQLLSRHQQHVGLRQHLVAHQRVARCRRGVGVRADAAARVRGDKRRVTFWLSDLRNWSFYPGTKSAVKLGVGTEPVRVGTKFEAQRDMLGLKLPMKYEVLELDPGRRLVLSGLSEHHTQMDQFFFMTDPHDPTFCCVRYMTDVRLREWRAYMQPLATRFASKVPEEAMANLQRTLNASQSPLAAPAFEAAFRREQQQQRAAAAGGSSRGGGGGGSSSSASNSRAGTASTRGGSQGSKRGLSSGWLKNMFTGSFSSVDDETTSSSSAAAAAAAGSGGVPDAIGLDPMGFYSMLGLAPHSGVGEEEIRAAYRRLALQLHPDRHVNSDAAARADAAQRFAALLKAYDTLRDPQRRALYDAGQLMEATLEF